MALFVTGLLVFLGLHSISIFAPGWRDRMAARLGNNAWRVIYSVLSFASFIAMIIGYGEARSLASVVYTPPTGLRHFTMLVMLPVFPLLFSAYLPGRIKSATKHPMLLSVLLWGIAHLMANGTTVDLMLFGGFALWATLDMASFRYRQARPIDPAMRSRYNDWIAAGLGLALYAGFVGGLHGWLIGVPIITS